MLARFLFLLFFIAPDCLLAAHYIDDSWVRLRLHENLKTFSIKGTHIELRDTADKSDDYLRAAARKSESQNLLIQFQTKWKKSFLKITRQNENALFKQGSLFVSGENLTFQSQPIAGFLQFYKRSLGFDVIAYVKLRDYLKGVVSAEMPSTWPNETLKAQIVAARSYALYMVEQRKNSIFDLEASIKDQAYRQSSSSALDLLLDDTANLVLFNQNKRLFKTYYHSDCGGQTSSAKKVFGDTGFDAEVKDPYCQGHSWRLTIPKQEFENLVGPFSEIVSTFNPLKRAYTFDLRRSNDLIQTIDAQKLRLSLGSTRMKSTWAEIKQSGDSIEIKGKGFGHGVGMCQWGSRQMGLMKKSFKEILEFYYPKSLLVSASVDQLHF